jgi:deoxycytidine triphosphate deaminase
MILTGHEIERERANGRITIDPFIPEQVNPNSYNFRLGKTLRVYGPGVLDVRQANGYDDIEIPEDGYVLEPGRLYLAHTIEVLGSDHYAPTFAARSSVARLGVFINLSASLGDIGYKGQWTLQLYTMNRVRVYPGINIGQMMWWRPKGRIILYSGKYQGAAGPRSSDIYIDFDKQIARQRLPALYATLDRGEVGNKFAALAEQSHRFSVPAAFCIPASEYTGALSAGQRQALAAAFSDLHATIGAFFIETMARIEDLAARIRMPEQLRRLVRLRVNEIFDGPADMEFAVRSSGLDEDTAGGSLAGVHDSILGVRGPDEVAAAIERCWRSFYAAPAVAARIRRGDFSWQPRLAVIVQAQLRPRLAGVAFTGMAAGQPGPAEGPGDDSGDDSGVVVEYVHGLADQLVAGVQVPARVTAADLADSRARTASPIPDQAALEEVVRLARRLRQHHGHDVDVEWALDEQGVHLIQVRPQTADATAADHAQEPAADIHRLYVEDLPTTFSLGEVAGVYGSYTVKRGPAYRLAAEHGIAVGRGWVVRTNGRGLHDARTVGRLRDALEEGSAGECVLDVGDTLRQIVVPKAEAPARLAELMGAGPDATRLHTVIARDFIRGELGLITRLAGDGLVVEYTEAGLMALNRGTAGADAIVVADCSRDFAEPGNLTAGPGGERLLSHLADLARFTQVMKDRYGDVALEWVFAAGRPHFVDYSVLGADHVTLTSTGAILISRGTARGRLLRLTDDDLLSRLSIGPAVSIDKAADVSEHDGLARIFDKVTSLPEPPIIHASRPYAVLSVLIGHVAGFVFDEGSTLGHLPILLREAAIPAVAASGFDGEGEVVISDGTLTLAGRRGDCA